MGEYINPKYSKLVQYIRSLPTKEVIGMAACSNCNGTGWVIVTDSEGNTHGGTCMSCQGSGEAPTQ